MNAHMPPEGLLKGLAAILRQLDLSGGCGGVAPAPQIKPKRRDLSQSITSVSQSSVEWVYPNDRSTPNLPAIRKRGSLRLPLRVEGTNGELVP
jgi:hypothetical protein